MFCCDPPASFAAMIARSTLPTRAAAGTGGPHISDPTAPRSSTVRSSRSPCCRSARPTTAGSRCRSRSRRCGTAARRPSGSAAGSGRASRAARFRETGRADAGERDDVVGRPLARGLDLRDHPRRAVRAIGDHACAGLLLKLSAMLRSAAAPVSSDHVSRRSVLPAKLLVCAFAVLMNGIGRADAASAVPRVLITRLLPALKCCGVSDERCRVVRCRAPTAARVWRNCRRSNFRNKRNIRMRGMT